MKKKIVLFVSVVGAMMFLFFIGTSASWSNPGRKVYESCANHHNPKHTSTLTMCLKTVMTARGKVCYLYYTSTTLFTGRIGGRIPCPTFNSSEPSSTI